MSQRRINQQVEINGGAEDVLIIAGWDRPLNGFFLTVFNNEEDVIFDNLLNYTETIEEQIKLAEENLETKLNLPDEFIQQVKSDQNISFEGPDARFSNFGM